MLKWHRGTVAATATVVVDVVEKEVILADFMVIMSSWRTIMRGRMVMSVRVMMVTMVTGRRGMVIMSVMIRRMMMRRSIMILIVVRWRSSFIFEKLVAMVMRRIVMMMVVSWS